MSQVQERYIHLVREITQLQWVRESLPSHSKYYESLKKKLEKQIQLKDFSEKER
jgi:tRNA U54 and U55 pseudouridine synthase Pus10